MLFRGMVHNKTTHILSTNLVKGEFSHMAQQCTGLRIS